MARSDEKSETLETVPVRLGEKLRGLNESAEAVLCCLALENAEEFDLMKVALCAEVWRCEWRV
jgi:hypothetical protein